METRKAKAAYDTLFGQLDHERNRAEDSQKTAEASAKQAEEAHQHRELKVLCVVLIVIHQNRIDASPIAGHFFSSHHTRACNVCGKPTCFSTVTEFNPKSCPNNDKFKKTATKMELPCVPGSLTVRACCTPRAVN